MWERADVCRRHKGRDTLAGPADAEALTGGFQEGCLGNAPSALASWAAPAAGPCLQPEWPSDWRPSFPCFLHPAHEQPCIQHLLCAKSEAPRPSRQLAPGTHMGTLAGNFSRCCESGAPRDLRTNSQNWAPSRLGLGTLAPRGVYLGWPLQTCWWRQIAC